MSLYYEAAKFIVSSANSTTDSLKAHVYKATDLKCKPAQIFALVSEATKWSPVLSNVIERADLLKQERKITPALSILLVHDLLLAKDGVAAPKEHALKLAVSRHKARLHAEFTRARIKSGFASIDAWKKSLEARFHGSSLANGDASQAHLRWVRVNSLRSSLQAELDTTFSGYDTGSVSSVKQTASTDERESGAKQRLCVDAEVPDLLALPQLSTEEIIKTQAYKTGRLILQDKASCFPALLLDPQPDDGDFIDACAAPGNKTTHLAALLNKAKVQRPRSGSINDNSPSTQTIYAVERSPMRAKTLTKMVRLAGAEESVECLEGQDFLTLDPHDKHFSRVGALLLDPSCSGSGIVGREADQENSSLESEGKQSNSHAETRAILPRLELQSEHQASKGKKRKRGAVSQPTHQPIPAHGQHNVATDVQVMVSENGTSSSQHSKGTKHEERLKNLSTFQLKLLQHAFRFPAARKIVYSTCSMHCEENELVVFKALQSSVAKQHGWRVLKRSEQVKGLREWPFRGTLSDDYTVEGAQVDTEVLEACIRCRKGEEEGTMGFFVVGFVRDGGASEREVLSKGDGFGSVGAVESDDEEDDGDNDEDEEWAGFSDAG